MWIGGRVDGALGDVRVRSSKASHNLTQWLLRSCPTAISDKSHKVGSSILECASDDDVS
jgi:hypothetical protein